MHTRWLRAALCRRFSHLPWLHDASEVTDAQTEAMRTVCLACPVTHECSAFVTEEGITGGFWAGAARKPGAGERGGAA